MCVYFIICASQYLSVCLTVSYLFTSICYLYDNPCKTLCGFCLWKVHKCKYFSLTFTQLIPAIEKSSEIHVRSDAIVEDWREEKWDKIEELAKCIFKTIDLLILRGAFLLPYLVFVVTCGVPLFLLETAMGQYTQEGAITIWHNLCPLAAGKSDSLSGKM